MNKVLRESQIVSGPCAVWVLSDDDVIVDIAPVFNKFTGQSFINLVSWLASKFGWCEITPIVGTELLGYGSQQLRLFR